MMVFFMESSLLSLDPPGDIGSESVGGTRVSVASFVFAMFNFTARIKLRGSTWFIKNLVTLVPDLADSSASLSLKYEVLYDTFITNV